MSIARIRNAVPGFTQSQLICAALVYGPRPAFAQTPAPSSDQAEEAKSASGTAPSSDQASENEQQQSTQSVICGPAHLVQCLKDIGHDQAGIWTSQLRCATMRKHSRALASIKAESIPHHLAVWFYLCHSRRGGTLHVVGRLTHNDHLAETGRLGTEAVIDATLVAEALKLATNRERPDAGNGTGGFWPHGTRTFSDSFPSGQAIGSWALARVIAAEYPNTLTQVGVYAFATAISVSRVTSRKHFPSDALVGSVFGYLIGGYVVRHHAGQDFDSGFSFIPMVDVSTHTFGASVEMRPDQLDLAKVARLGRL